MILISLTYLAISVLVFENVSGVSIHNERVGRILQRVKRYNLNLGVGVATGQGANHQFGGATNWHYGLQSGVRTPGGYIQNYNQDYRSQSNAFSTGYGAPPAFASGGTNFRPGGIGGYTTVGQGGYGNAFANDYSQNIRVPLPYGSSLLSNLKVKDNGEENQEEEEQEEKQEEKQEGNEK